VTTLTPAQIAGYARAAGFTGDALRWATAIALAESGGNPAARHVNSNGSVDRGLWQINTVHKDVTDAQAYDPAGAASAAFRISSQGRNFRPWVTYTNGMAGAQLQRATAAANAPANVQNVVTWTPTPIPGLPLIPLPDSWGTPGIQTPGDVTNPLAVVDGLARVAAIIGSVVAKSATWLSDSHNWLRILFTVAGSVAALAGLVMLANSGVGGPVGAAGSAAKSATSLVPVARVAKAAKAAKVASAAKAAKAAA
jgi:hypothetical protein